MVRAFTIDFSYYGKNYTAVISPEHGVTLYRLYQNQHNSRKAEEGFRDAGTYASLLFLFQMDRFYAENGLSHIEKDDRRIQSVSPPETPGILP